MVEKVNVVSAFLQAMVVLVFYFLVLKLFKIQKIMQERTSKRKGQGGMEIGRSLVAFSASMFLAFSLIFWKYATKFEVFPLNNLLVVLLLLVAVKIWEMSGFPERNFSL